MLFFGRQLYGIDFILINIFIHKYDTNFQILPIDHTESQIGHIGRKKQIIYNSFSQETRYIIMLKIKYSNLTCKFITNPFCISFNTCAKAIQIFVWRVMNLAIGTSSRWGLTRTLMRWWQRWDCATQHVLSNIQLGGKIFSLYYHPSSRVLQLVSSEHLCH